MIRNLWILMAGCLLLAGAASAEEVPPPELVEGAKVWRVTFEGNTVLDEATLNDILANKGPNYFWNRWPLLRKSQLADFDEEELAKDEARLVKRYQQEGFYNATAKAEWATEKEGKRVIVTYTLTEGPPTFVTAFDIAVTDRNMTAAARQDWQQRLKEVADLNVGGIFNATSYFATQGAVAKLAGEASRALATIDGKARVRRETQEADVQITVFLGPLCTYGDITIVGNEIIDTEDITPAVEIAPGEAVDTRQVRKTQNQIYDYGYFRAVNIETEQVEDTNVIDARIQVSERKLRRMRFSIGYGTEEEFRTRASWRKLYFLRGPRIFEVSAKYSSLVVGGQVDLTQRFWPSRQTTLNATILGEQETTDAYILQKYGSRGELVYGSRGRIPRSGGLSFTRERYTDILADSGADLSNLPPVDEDEWFLHAFAFGSAKMDRTDDSFNPTRGYRLFLNAQVASQILGSDVGYWKSALEGNLFLPFWQTWVLALRLKGGVGQPTENSESILPGERYYSGGSSTVRGYGYQRLGPLDADNDPIGGATLAEGNIEVRYPLYKDVIGGVFFLDGGMVAQDEFDFTSEEVRYGAGLGLRVFTPIGPIRLDYGSKLNPAKEDPDGKWRIHFSISHTF